MSKKADKQFDRNFFKPKKVYFAKLCVPICNLRSIYQKNYQFSANSVMPFIAKNRTNKCKILIKSTKNNAKKIFDCKEYITSSQDLVF